MSLTGSLSVLFVVQALFSVPSDAPSHRLRQVDLSKDATSLHAVPLVGAPHLTTTVRLPDSFASSSISCGGDCVDAASLAGGKVATGGANWVLDVRPKERTLHIWPANLPSADNPSTAFRCNIVVALDGGDIVNLALELVDAHCAAQSADAVVDVLLPRQKSFAGRLEGEREELVKDAQAKATVDYEAHLLQQLSGGTRCQEKQWHRPHRSERMVVRLHQLCSTDGAFPLRWAVFSVENRAHVPLQLAEARLSPEGEEVDDLSAFIERGTSFEQTVLAPGAQMRGVALLELTDPKLRGSAWSLQIEAQAPRQDRVRLNHITF